MVDGQKEWLIHARLGSGLGCESTRWRSHGRFVGSLEKFICRSSDGSQHERDYDVELYKYT